MSIVARCLSLRVGLEPCVFMDGNEDLVWAKMHEDSDGCIVRIEMCDSIGRNHASNVVVRRVRRMS